jgi:hypothetical protein
VLLRSFQVAYHLLRQCLSPSLFHAEIFAAGAGAASATPVETCVRAAA